MCKGRWLMSLGARWWWGDIMGACSSLPRLMISRKLEEASAELEAVQEKIRSKRENLVNAKAWLESDSDA